MNSIYTADLTRKLPEALKNDRQVSALARAAAAGFHDTLNLIYHTVIFPRLDELPEEILDILAYDFKVDWYDYSYPQEVKRATIRDAMSVYRKMGTKYAVETALGNVFPGTKVEEWFEYGGDPYMFRVVIGSPENVTADQQAAVMQRIRYYKNLRSHLDSIRYDFDPIVFVNENRLRLESIQISTSFANFGQPIRLNGQRRLDGSWTLGQRADKYLPLVSFGVRDRFANINQVTASLQETVALKHTQVFVMPAVGIQIGTETSQSVSQDSFMMTAGIKTASSLAGTLTRDTMWRLDGSVRLDGSRRLNADIIKEDI